MPIWKVRSIAAQPSITLVRWRVYETEFKERHFVVSIHKDGTVSYVRMREIPEPVRSIFERRMLGATVPVIAGERDCVCAWDWQDFIEGARWK